MSRRDVCDRCLTVNKTERPFSTVWVELTREAAPMGQVKLDLCPSCEKVVTGLVESRICTMTTPDECKGGMFAPAEKPKRGRKKKEPEPELPPLVPLPDEQTSVTISVPEGVTVIPMTEGMDMGVLEATIGEAVGEPMFPIVITGEDIYEGEEIEEVD